jgi:Phosphatidate cytidylyltransferase, mitochondrial
MIPRSRGLLLLFPIKPCSRLRCIRFYSQSILRRQYSKDQKYSSSEPIQFPKYNEKTHGADVKKFSQLPVNFGANQHISIDDTLKEKLQAVLWQFNAPIRYAFAYGSGVFQQAGTDQNVVLHPPDFRVDGRCLWWILYLGFRIRNIGMG